MEQKHEKINFVVKWLACTFICCGAVATTARFDPLNLWFFNAGNLCYAIWGWRIREWNMVVVNAVLTSIYVVGLIMR
jgi:hypothetical protein